MSSPALDRGHVRPAALAGRWYPADAETLSATVRDFIDAASPPPLPDGHLRALVAPHAGHIYSGPIAGFAFAALRRAPRRPARAILVGPAHRVAFRGLSAGDFSRYAVPNGTFPVDRDAIAALERDALVGFHPAAHATEHALEILLPFLAEVTGPLPVLPLLVGAAAGADVARALEAALRPDDILIISSDLSHFLPYDRARTRDLGTLAALVEDRAATLDGHDACGVRGLQALEALARPRGWRPTLLAYANSGDTAGDRDSVVGYAALALTAAPA